MSLFNLTEKFDLLKSDMQAYIESSTEYYKLDLFKKLMKGITALANSLIIGSFILVFLLFISVGVAINIGEVLESLSLGYFIMGGFYLFVVILLAIFGKPLITNFLLKKYSRIFFNQGTQEDVLDDEFKNLNQ